MGPDLRIGEVLRPFATQNAQNIFGHSQAHASAPLIREAGQMRGKYHLIKLEKWIISRRGLWVKNVEPGSAQVTIL